MTKKKKKPVDKTNPFSCTRMWWLLHDHIEEVLLEIMTPGAWRGKGIIIANIVRAVTDQFLENKGMPTDCRARPPKCPIPLAEIEGFARGFNPRTFPWMSVKISDRARVFLWCVLQQAQQAASKPPAPATTPAPAAAP